MGTWKSCTKTFMALSLLDAFYLKKCLKIQMQNFEGDLQGVQPPISRHEKRDCHMRVRLSSFTSQQNLTSLINWEIRTLFPKNPETKKCPATVLLRKFNFSYFRNILHKMVIFHNFSLQRWLGEFSEKNWNNKKCANVSVTLQPKLF